MMLKYNKITALLVVLALVLSLLSGCVGQEPTATDGPETPTAPSTEETADPTDAEDPTDATDPTDTQAPTDATDPTDTQAPTQATDPAPTEPEQDWTVDPYEGMTAEEFYADYTTASCYEDACWRTKHFFMSGSLDVPGQYWETAEDQPMDGQLYIRNTDCRYEDNGNTYIVVDSYGVEIMRVYKGAAYITLEEVAAYMYAFGGSSADLPANYTSKKSTSVKSSPWGIYLRVNHSYFSGDTRNYPYEPVLPNISGCGGDLQYYEMDIGTTGTVTPGYPAALYNNGTKITRGAARLVYSRCDLNGNGVYEENEVYVFYTYNHYNDFVEYLNYYGGWGQVFGNTTGGGEYSSKTNCNPTPYPETAYSSFAQLFG